MKVLVTGVNGQLGYDVSKELLLLGIDVYGTGSKSIDALSKRVKQIDKLNYHKMDITNKEEVADVFSFVKPDAVIHCAAWTQVDAAEEENNKLQVWNVNRNGTMNIADACAKYDASMIYISTDYVFNGEGSDPWLEDTEVFEPLNEYGKSKLAGEKIVRSTLEKYFIVRISWVFGINGNNFVKTMLKVGQNHKVIRVINDQIGNPTYTCDLARLLANMILTDKYGCYHVTNEGDYISWYDFACEIFKKTGMDVSVVPVSTKEYGDTKAKRPSNSRLSKERIQENGFKKLPNWQNALDRFLIELAEKEK